MQFKASQQLRNPNEEKNYLNIYQRNNLIAVVQPNNHHHHSPTSVNVILQRQQQQSFDRREIGDFQGTTKPIIIRRMDYQPEPSTFPASTPQPHQHQQPEQQQPIINMDIIHPENAGMSLISSNRQYSIGMGKDQQPNSRLWIETIEDPKLVHLYCLDSSSDDKDVFICGHCKQFNRFTRIEILHPEGGKTELWEDITHLPSCIRQKIDVEKYLLGFERPIVPPRQYVKKVQRRRSRAESPESPYRSRSRSPLTPTTNPSTPYTPTTDGGSAGQYRGRKPNMQAMSIVPKTHWKLRNAENGVDVDTKLFIFTHPTKNLGREFSFGVTFEGGVLFYCDNCLFLTRERQKRKAFYKVINGKVVIREANHYATCRPYECRHAFYPEENDGGNNNNEGEDIADENDGDYDSQEPETTIEYDSTPAALTPDITEPARQEFPKITPKPRSRTIRKDPVVKPSSAKTVGRPPSSKRPTFVPVFSTATPPQPISSSSQPDARRVSIASSNSIVAHPTPSFYSATSSSSSQPQTPIFSNGAAPVIPTPKPINHLQRPLPSIPAKFTPYILPVDRTIIYNTPSSGQMRDIATKFGFQFSYKCFQFWSSTLSSISEITGASKPTKTHPTSSYDDFASLSIFLTGVEEYGQQIQEGIKEYFCNSYFNETGFTLPRDVVQHTLITNSLTDVHLSVLSKMINCSIAVFDGPQIQIFGLQEDETTPFMILKKVEDKYRPVLGISN